MNDTFARLGPRDGESWGDWVRRGDFPVAPPPDTTFAGIVDGSCDPCGSGPALIRRPS